MKQTSTGADGPKKVLHVGCGPYNPDSLHLLFRGPDWQEIRLDIDPGVNPDIKASLTDMAAVATDSVDALYSSHNLEHLYPHEVSVGLKEFLRVLKPEGFALITVPDLLPVAEAITQDRLDDPLYQSPAGPITPLDMLYGHRDSMARGNLFMAHKTGFTAKTLANEIIRAGFSWVKTAKDTSFSLWAKAYKRMPGETVANAPLW